MRSFAAISSPASNQAHPGRVSAALALCVWALAVVMRIGALAYLPAVRAFRNPAVASASLQLGDLVNALLAPVLATFGMLIVLHSTGRRYGWLMLATAFGLALLAFTGIYSQYALLVAPQADLPLGVLAAWVSDLWMLQIMLFACLPVLFPDGHLPSRRWRWVFRALIGMWGLLTLTYAFAERPLGYETFIAIGEIIPNPVGILPHFETATIALFGALTPLSILIGLASLVVRWRKAGSEVRQQIKWVLFSLVLLLAVVAAMFLVNVVLPQTIGVNLRAGQLLITISQLLLVGAGIALGMAMLKYRLYDIDLIINRTLVYGALTVMIVGMYALVVALPSTLVSAQGNLLLSLLAAGLLAVLFNPLRERLQRAANRLMFGQRDEPYTVLSRLGRQLSSSATPELTLETIAETIATVLKLPYTAIQLEEDGSFVTSAEYGIDSPGQLTLPLLHQNEVVGQLAVAPRSPGELLTAKDKQLLEDIAHQAGAVAHAVRLTSELQRSRERIVTTREEERRRLRRDLHDGLAPTLAALALTASTADNLIPDNPAAASDLLQDLQTEIRAAVDDIRRLVYDLRPPTLDELGLIAAIREYAAQVSHQEQLGAEVQPTPRMIVAAPDSLPPLPAAVEVAAYRIVREALTNAVRHAQAKTCTTQLTLGSVLQIEVVDDGIGLPENSRAGVGLLSMRERAEELGGSCLIERLNGSGTRVCARLPVVREYD